MRPAALHSRLLRTLAPALSLSLVVGSAGAAAAPGTAQAKRHAAPAPPVSPWDVEAREYLGTPQSEAAVNRGLAFLAQHQEPDGHWRSGGYANEVAISALALMAYLSAGNQPGRGRYGVIMQQTVDYLCRCVQMDGEFHYEDGSNIVGLIRALGNQGGPPMYGHGFATLALAEVYGMTYRSDLKRKLEAAVKLIEDTQVQNGNDFFNGGWRYNPGQQDADISVTVVQLLALRAARNAGLHVDQGTIDRAIAYIKQCANNRDGGFSYQVGRPQSGPARTGAAVLSLYMAGMPNSPECQGGLAYLRNNPMEGSTAWPYREHFYYTLYYVTQAMYQVGGADWQRWYPSIRDRLVREQDPDGSWSEYGNEAPSEAGIEYATAMAVLVLQVPAGLLPIYQK